MIKRWFYVVQRLIEMSMVRKHVDVERVTFANDDSLHLLNRPMFVLQYETEMGHYGPTAVHSLYDHSLVPPPPAMTSLSNHTSLAGHMPPAPHATAATYAPPTAPYPNYPTPTSTPMTSMPSLPVSEAQLKKDRDDIYG